MSFINLMKRCSLQNSHQQEKFALGLRIDNSIRMAFHRRFSIPLDLTESLSQLELEKIRLAQKLWSGYSRVPWGVFSNTLQGRDGIRLRLRS
jgi:hypothetical protein